MGKYVFLFLLGVLTLSFLSQPVQAIPPFAKKHNLKCTNCHSAFPNLNAAGREYKANGYRLTEEVEGEVQRNQKISEDLILERSFPLAGLIKGYVYDKKKDGKQKTRPLHEVEIMIGGNAYKNFSVWAEIEAEDENDFAPSIEMGITGWHPSPYANVLAGYGPYFFSDPYNTLADWGRRMTRSHRAPWDITNSYGSGVRLRSSTPFISFYGKANQFFYSVGYHRDLNDPEGEGGEDISGRAAVEFSPEFGEIATNFSIGGFGVFGNQGEEEETQREFTRAGIDIQAEIGDSFNLLFALLRSRDDTDSGIKENNTALYGELFWIFSNSVSSPTFVPLARLDYYERKDGEESFTDLSLNLSYYVVQNIKLSLEFWTNLRVPEGLKKQNRVTAFFTLLF